MTRHVRFGFIILLLISIVFLPYWIYVPTLLLAMIIFPVFWEAIVIAVIVDILYGHGLIFKAPLASVSFYIFVSLIILIPLRERLRLD